MKRTKRMIPSATDPNSSLSRRLHCHRHNGLAGTVGVIRVHLKAFGDSVTPDGHNLVTAISDLLDLLDNNIRTYRVEPDGTITTMEHPSKDALRQLESE